ncbi:LLM class F420-dependent oxidoreductase [Jiangella muralis]|uniref:LLM class F420-dependent oxidoreductase n=1 Tax=Jiangella muralis TaxID=702383 RepID=UPI00069D9363|nr:LLM class F420-dependent oxidoreductase [Jiangella muralis]
MRFGISTLATDEGVRPDKIAEEAERRGFESLFFSEHSHIPVSTKYPLPGQELPRSYCRSLDPFIAMTVATEATSTLLVGTGVAILVQRDLLYTAKEAATLDYLSNGRLILGVGVGWNLDEMRNHGIDPHTRGALLDEQIPALRALWTQDRGEYHGEYVDFDPVLTWPKPIQHPHPPIYVGGSSRAAADRARRLDCGWMPIAVDEPAKITSQLDLVRDGTGSDVPVTVCVLDDDVDVVAGYVDAKVERILLHLDPAPEGATFNRLDQLAELIDAAL